MLNENLNLKGRLLVVLRDENGNIKYENEYNNYITNAGKALIAQSIYKTTNSPVAPTVMGVGIGNTLPAVLQVVLQLLHSKLELVQMLVVLIQ